MIRKTLIAVVVAGALGVPTGAAAETSKLEVASAGRWRSCRASLSSARASK
jgi:hypothetical protein